MSLSLPDGFSVRAATREDAPAINELVVAADEAVQGWSDSTEAELFDWWRLADLEQDSWVVERRRPCRGLQRALRTRRERGVGRLRPSHEDGARARGVAPCERRGSRPRTRASGRTHVVPCAGRCRPTAVRAARLSRGAPVLPDVDRARRAAACARVAEGFRVGTFEPDDASAFHAALDEAFVDEWTFISMPFEEWVEHST